MKNRSYRFILATILFGSALFASCEKLPGLQQDYYYNLYTDCQNFNGSDFEAFAPLWEDDCPIMFSIHDSRQAADQAAIDRFHQILGQIDDSAACAGLQGDDYVTAIIQRVEGRPYDLESRHWTSSGVE